MYVVKLTAANVPTVQFLAALAVTIVIYLATLLSQGDKLTPGAFVSFIAAMSLMFEPIRRLTGVNAILQKGFAACDSIFEVLDKKVEIHENIGLSRKVAMRQKRALRESRCEAPNVRKIRYFRDSRREPQKARKTFVFSKRKTEKRNLSSREAS